MKETCRLNIVSADSLLTFSQSSYEHKNGLRCINGISYALLNQEATILLTKRQVECLSLLTLGKTAKDIAKALGISFRTVQEHIQNIKVKAKVQYSKELVTIGVKNNLSGYGLHLIENS